jgi:uncharacterized membrane protein YphA (DoxX/SURF4 family)
VASSFFLGFMTKFWWFGPEYAERFVDWGYPSWFRFVVGGIEGVCAVLLVIPGQRFRFIGAAVLVLVMVGAVTTHIVNGFQASDNVAATSMLVIVAVIALANWPSDWRDLLRPGQADRLAGAHATLQPTVPR